MTKTVPSLAMSQKDQSFLLIGQNSRGNWVVRDRSGRRGGLFTSRAVAFRYVQLEAGDRAPSLIDVPGTLELEPVH